MFKKIDEDLRTNLHLRHPAIGVTFSGNGVSAPAYSGNAPAGCSFWEAAFQGSIKTSALDHTSCSIGIYTHNLDEAPAGYDQQLSSVLQVLGEMQYLRSEDLALVPVLKDKPKHVLYGPLCESMTAPDVVLLFVDSRQGLVIVEAAQQVDGSLPPVMGRPACGVIPQVMNSGKAAMTLGCCGARAYLESMSDNVALWALPGSRIADYSARIAALAGANEALGQFHALRLQDVKSGLRPTYEDSLRRISGKN
jgi:uncharacterized protein (DUF169 family)